MQWVRHVLPVLAFCGLAAFAHLSSVRAEDDAGPPQGVRKDDHIPPPKGAAFADPSTWSPEYDLHDVTGVHVHAEKMYLHFWVRFARPLRDGIHQGVQVQVDCDDDLRTGIHGADLMVHVTIGSRFRPNTESRAPKGLLPAFRTRTCAWAFAPNQTDMDGAPRVFTWRGTRPVTSPLVCGATVFFRFPLTLLKQHGLKYNNRIGVRLKAEGVIAEHPVSLEYRCADKGVPITVDGKDGDWSGGPRVKDKTGELHPVAEGLDIEELQVDHAPKKTFARLRLAAAGFASHAVPADNDDITVYDRITFAFEPLGDVRYMSVKRVEVPIQVTSGQRDGGRWAVGTQVVECSIDRPASQTEFRVMAWSEATRIDYVPSGQAWLHYTVPSTAWARIK